MIDNNTFDKVKRTDAEIIAQTVNNLVEEGFQSEIDLWYCRDGFCIHYPDDSKQAFGNWQDSFYDQAGLCAAEFENNWASTDDVLKLIQSKMK